MNDKKECKLADFGLLRDDCGSTTNMGTLRYCSPELVNDPNTFSDKSDIWALGIIVHYLCTNTHLVCYIFLWHKYHLDFHILFVPVSRESSSRIQIN
jgi:serine/threonine protein kinase